MERFEVKRGVVKQVTAEGGLAALAGRHFDNIDDKGENSFEGSHGIMSMVRAEYTTDGKLQVEVVNERPDFDDANAMAAAMDTRKRWTSFLDEATGYDAKKRGDKAKEWVKKATKAKSAVAASKHLMSMAKNLSDEKREAAQDLIDEIETALSEGENTRAAGRADKLTKLLSP